MGFLGLPLWYWFFWKNQKMGRILLPTTINFSYFHFGISILLPSAYAVRLGLGKKWVFQKMHGNTIFTDPTFDLFFRRGYYHFSFWKSWKIHFYPYHKKPVFWPLFWWVSSDNTHFSFFDFTTINEIW